MGAWRWTHRSRGSRDQAIKVPSEGIFHKFGWAGIRGIETMNRHASMNGIYRLIWSEVRRAWVPVAEMSRGGGKSGRARSIASLNLVAGGAQSSDFLFEGLEITTGGQRLHRRAALEASLRRCNIESSTFRVTKDSQVGFGVSPHLNGGPCPPCRARSTMQSFCSHFATAGLI
jgi:hypothetical protein